MVSVAHDTPLDATDRRPVRVLGIFAHPDDETICAGGTLAKYASAGADVRVVSLTKGGAGQIRDANAATRSTLDGSSRAGARRGGGRARALRDEVPGPPGRRPALHRRGAPRRPRVGAAARGRPRCGHHLRSRRVLRTPGPRGRRGSGHGGLLRDAVHPPDPAVPLPPAAKQDAAEGPAGGVGGRADDPLQGHAGLRPRPDGVLERDDGARVRRRLRQGGLVPVRLLPARTGRAGDDHALPPVRAGGDPAGGRRRSGGRGRPVGVGRVHRRGGHRHRPAAQRARGGGGRRHVPDVPRVARLLRRARGPGGSPGSRGRCPRGTRSTRG